MKSVTASPPREWPIRPMPSAKLSLPTSLVPTVWSGSPGTYGPAPLFQRHSSSRLAWVISDRTRAPPSVKPLSKFDVLASRLITA